MATAPRVSKAQPSGLPHHQHALAAPQKLPIPTRLLEWGHLIVDGVGEQEEAAVGEEARDGVVDLRRHRLAGPALGQGVGVGHGQVRGLQQVVHRLPASSGTKGNSYHDRYQSYALAAAQP